MMVGPLPHEINQIKRDVREMIYGPHGYDVVLHWLEVSGDQNSYGEYDTETPATETVRAAVHMVTDRNASSRPLQTDHSAELQSGDADFIFDPTLDLTGRRGLWFEVAGLGDFVPDAKPPLGANTRVNLIPNGHTFAQEIRARPKR